jgi:hypothetical protein
MVSENLGFRIRGLDRVTLIDPVQPRKDHTKRRAHNPALQPTRKNGQPFISTARRRSAEFFVMRRNNTK